MPIPTVSPAAPAILLCMGTRPEAIKMAPVVHALQAVGLGPLILHSGQHNAVAYEVYRFFGIQPDAHLMLDRERTSLSHLGARLLDGIDQVISRTPVQAVLVHGDTATTLAAAQAAFFNRIPVGHVEAGLRSHDPSDPFPEEKNREMVSRLATWHFAPTAIAARNLRDENIAEDRIYRVGNTVVDAATWGVSQIDRPGVAAPERLKTWAASGRLVLVTAHRRESWGPPIEGIARAVAELAEAHPDLRFLGPIHPNPAIRESVEIGLRHLPAQMRDRVHLTSPLTYPRLLWALRESWLVLTDSGGIQEEAAALDRPVLVLRKHTERPEIVEAGGGRLVGTDPATIHRWVSGLATDPVAYASLRCAENPYGDGRAAERIARVLRRELMPAEEAVQSPELRLVPHASAMSAVPTHLPAA